jgi:2-dehydropantoate 2-reductase
MRVTIIGTGAIGGTVGAYLIRNGHDVLLVDAAREHVEAMARDGLAIEGRDHFRVPVRAVTPDALPDALRGRPQEAVMLAVKALHTEGAVDMLAPLLAPTGYVISMQNGLNERVIAARIGAERTVGAFVNFDADYIAPGRVMYGGKGALYLGELDGRMTPRVHSWRTALSEAFLPETTVTSNIWGYLWGKMGYAAMLFATATVDETMADVLGDPRNGPLLANLAAEVVRVADAEHVTSEGFEGYDPDAMRFTTPRAWDAIRRSLDAMATRARGSLKQKSGIWRDLAVRRRRTEVDYHVGAVLDLAHGHGLRLPLTARLIEVIHDLEEGRRQMAPANLEELRRLNEAAYSGEIVPHS